MSKIVNIYQAKTQFSRLVDEAAHGEEIVIARNGKPVAKLVAMEKAETGKLPWGLYAGQDWWIAPDFDRTDEELIAAFEGRDE